MKLINRIQAKDEYQEHEFIYVLEFRYKNHYGYTTGVSDERPMQEIFRLSDKYKMKGKILRYISIPKNSNLLTEFLLKIKHLKIKDIFYKDIEKEFDSFISEINYSDYYFIVWLPNFCYLKEELQGIKDTCVDFNDDGYLVQL